MHMGLLNCCNMHRINRICIQKYNYRTWALVVGIVISMLLTIETNAENTDLCASTSFSSKDEIEIKGSPMSLNWVSNNSDSICIAVIYRVDAEWISFGITEKESMVNSPPKNVIVYTGGNNSPELYVISSRLPSGTVKQSDQSSIAVYSTSHRKQYMQFTFQRSLKAKTQYDLPIKFDSTTKFIWSYGNSWPISSHASLSERGIASINFQSRQVEEVVLYLDTYTLFLYFGMIILMLLSGLFLRVNSMRYSCCGRVCLHGHFIEYQPQSKCFRCFTLNFFNSLFDLKNGEMVLVLLYCMTMACIVLQFFYVVDDVDLSIRRLWSLITGHWSVFNLAVLILPISRMEKMWIFFFGTSLDRILKYHRWLSRVFILCTIVHLVLSLDDCTLISFSNCGTQKVYPFYGLIGFICFAIMSLFAIHWIRMCYFEWFYFVHRFFFPFGIVAAFLHCDVNQWILIFPTGLYLISFIYTRFKSYSKRYQIQHISCQQNIVMFSMKLTSNTKKIMKKIQPGAYCYLLIPNISCVEWHPFSPILIPEQETFGFAIKSVDKKGYTQRLYKYMEQLKQSHDELNMTSYDSINIYMDGPYGHLSFNPYSYDILICIAGGIGVTPFLSMYNALKKDKQLSCMIIIWTVQKKEDFCIADAFLFHQHDEINELIPNASPLNYDQNDLYKKIYFYASKEIENGFIGNELDDTKITYTCGRPNLKRIIEPLIFPIEEVEITMSPVILDGIKTTQKSAAIAACGPIGLMEDAQALAMEFNLPFHKEKFYE